MRSWIATLLFTLAAGAFVYGLYVFMHWPFGKAEVAVPLFLGLLTGGLLAWQEQAMKADPQGFMRRFMLGLTAKLAASVLAIAAILVYLPRDRAVTLALTFTGLYLLFLVFTTSRLGQRSRNLPRP